MPTVVLLGPQRFAPTLGQAVARSGVRGRLASVTAGWQEREAEDLELHEHLGGRTVNLMLYSRGEDVFERDPELAVAYRERQARLRELQDLYRTRLGYAQGALRELEQRRGDPALLGPEKEAALAAIRAIDEHHLRRVAALHAGFEARWAPTGRPALARHLRQIEQALEGVEGLLIAGGHVAILLNRLRLFGVAGRLGERAVFAWSAGAMAIAERVVLFHHFPPQGYGNTEVLENGLALARGVVPLPHARRRLALDDRRRVALLARRFAPAACVAMGDGGWMIDDGAGWEPGPGMSRLAPDGSVGPLEAA